MALAWALMLCIIINITLTMTGTIIVPINITGITKRATVMPEGIPPNPITMLKMFTNPILGHTHDAELKDAKDVKDVKEVPGIVMLKNAGHDQDMVSVEV